MTGVSRSDFAHLGPAARAQIQAALAEGTTTQPRSATKRRAAPADLGTLRCTACGHTETNSDRMDTHCDTERSHRYELVLVEK